MPVHKYRAEIFVDNNWCFLSRHADKDYAIINAEVTSKSRGCASRVILKGQIIQSFEGTKKNEQAIPMQQKAGKKAGLATTANHPGRKANKSISKI